MAGYLRLQALTTATDGTAQRLDAAADVGDFGAVTAQVRTAVAGGVGSFLALQHAAVLDEQAFDDCVEVSLEAVGTQAFVLPPLLRYLRWKATVVGATPSFQVDLVGREGAPSPQWRPQQAAKTGGQVVNYLTTATLTWDADTSIFGDGVSWDNANEAIAVSRTGLLALHFDVSAWDNASFSPVNANVWLEEYDGSTWSEILSSRSYIWATGGTHTATVHRAVSALNRKYRVRVIHNGGGTNWLLERGTFWARWID